MVLQRSLRLAGILVIAAALLTLSQGVSAQFPSIFLAWKPDGAMLAVSSGTTVQILDATTMTPLNTFSGLRDQSAAPTWSPDGTQLAIANGSEVQIWQQPWDGVAAQLVTAFQSASYIRSLAWGPDGARIAVAHHQLELWDLSAAPPAVLLYSIQAHDFFMNQVSWSPTGTLLATASGDKKVKIWDAATGEALSTMRVVTDTTTMPLSEAFSAALSVSWSPDDTRLVFGAEDGTVRIWDRSVSEFSGADVATGWGDPWVFLGHEAGVWAVAWSPTGTRIASGSLDGTVRLWDATTGEQLRVIQVGIPIGSVVWSPDGSRLAYPGAGGAVSILISPTADASADQTASDADNSGFETVTLDGSASSDADGTIVSYAWAENGIEIARGVSPQVELAVGTHTITLTVTDDDDLTDTDEVVITVAAD